jgi:hypothetical protein
VRSGGASSFHARTFRCTTVVDEIEIPVFL